MKTRMPIAAALALSLTLGTAAPAALAQDGTGAATPTPPSACEIVGATWTGQTDNDITPMASPTGMATPSAGEGTIPVTFFGETPEAGEGQGGTSVADVLAKDLQAASTAIAGCLSDARYDTLVRITGDTWRGQLVGAGFPLTDDEFSMLAGAMPQVPYQILRVENAVATSDTTATADVTYELAHQVRYSTWEFELQEIDGKDVWTLQGETSMTPVAPANTDTLTVAIDAGGYTIADATVSGPSVAIEATNTDETDHEVLVLRLGASVSTEDLLITTGPSLPEGVTYVGQATVPAGGSGTLLLSGLQPGTYTIVDLLPNEQGLPNLSDGMSITFEVQ